MFKLVLILFVTINVSFAQTDLKNFLLPEVKSLSDINRNEKFIQFYSIYNFQTLIPKVENLKSLDFFYKYYQTGIASWYGPGFQGKKTANGEKYNMYGLTAAHKKLAFNTFVKVTNISNQKSIIVRINDRGPFIKGRIIDLSKAAKDSIGMDGLAKVTLEIVSE